MVLDSKYHRIYGIIESMVPAHLCFLDEVLPSINTLHVCACGREEAMRRLHASVRTSPTVCAEHLCLASCYGWLIILLQCVLHSDRDLSIHHLPTAHIYGLAKAYAHLCLCLLISKALHR